MSALPWMVRRGEAMAGDSVSAEGSGISGAIVKGGQCQQMSSCVIPDRLLMRHSNATGHGVKGHRAYLIADQRLGCIGCSVVTTVLTGTRRRASPATRS